MQFQASSTARESNASGTNNSAPTLSMLLEKIQTLQNHVHSLQTMVSYQMFDYAKFRKWLATELCPKTPYGLVPPPVSIVEDLPNCRASADRG